MQVDFRPTYIVDVWFQMYVVRFLSHSHRLVDHILVALICFVLRFFAGTQVNCQSLVFQISTMSRESLQPLSSICSGSEPFRPVEHLDFRRRWNIPANKSSNSAGEWSCVSVILIFLNLQLLSESRLLLQLSSIRYTLWMTLFGFETSKFVQIWVISVFYGLFPYSIQ